MKPIFKAEARGQISRSRSSEMSFFDDIKKPQDFDRGKCLDLPVTSYGPAIDVA